MASGKLLRQLIKSGVAGDPQSFRQASEQLIQEERHKQHHLLANDLERILYGGNNSLSPTPKNLLLPEVPVDKERGLPLLDVRHPQRPLEEIVLVPEAFEVIENVLEEYRREDLLRSYGMRPVEKLLFFGPPGCGKTLAAEIIAYEVDRPLIVIRLDALVSSYLGETAANLRKVFDYIAKIPVVALFDEFDALGKERDDGTEHGELRRVVNAVLQMMDAYQGKSLIVAATNHEHILDSAIWRRFDELLQFRLPNQKQLQLLLKLKLRGVRREFDLDNPELLDLFKGISPALIERIIRRAVKRMILKGSEFLNLRDLSQAKLREKLDM